MKNNLENNSNIFDQNLLNEIKECQKCGDLPKLTCIPIKLGKSKILVLEESPAKDG